LVFYSSVITMMHGPTNIKNNEKYLSAQSSYCELAEISAVTTWQWNSNLVPLPYV